MEGNTAKDVDTMETYMKLIFEYNLELRIRRAKLLHVEDSRTNITFVNAKRLILMYISLRMK